MLKPARRHCAECWTRLSEDEGRKVQTRYRGGEIRNELICAECDDQDDGFDPVAEFGTLHVRHGSVVG